MNRRQSANRVNVAIVGGGLAGLTTAALVARRGLKTVLLEQATEVGGLARTRIHDGFAFNLGPHALYRAGHARRVFRSLGVDYHAGQPPARGVVVYRGRASRLPANLTSLLTTRLLGVADKLQLATFMARLPRLDTAALDWVDVETWIGQSGFRPRVATLIRALLCLSTYCADMSQQSAGVALEQLRMAVTRGVDYLDGGWQTLVDGLNKIARATGVEIRTGVKVQQVIVQGDTVHALSLADGETIEADAIVLACGPGIAARLVGGACGAEIGAWHDRAIPIRVATLDVALRRLPRPQPTFALGIDELWYYSVHSAVARLAPPLGALVHVAKYLPTDVEHDPKQVEQQLMGVLDRFQPDWREALAYKQFLPSLVVSNDVPRAATRGLADRPGPRVPHAAGLYVVGDWVGPRGHLADAAVASAEQAAEDILLRDANRVATETSSPDRLKIDVV